MSSNIDERIVQMEFNNGQFERGIKESTRSLEEFQEKLKFKEAIQSAKDLEKATNGLSFAGLEKSVYAIENVFTSVYGRIKARVIDKLADDIYGFGKKYMKMFTVDQLSSGWTKYADKTQAVQTIIAATGKDIDYVNERLAKLNWFTDETSYNFVDMASNIGKFTANKIDLDDAVTAMEGIATLASVSGQGVSEASRAMYNFSQALGVGTVKLMDWRSIENANMATAEFKETIIATAKKLGKLTAAGKTLKGTQVTVENFSSTLAEGWFDKDVLMESLRLYGEYADAVYEASDHGLIPAAQAMKKVSDEEMKLGAKAFRAAQEAKTLREAIDATTDAVSSGWMNTFEIVFGNYEQQKVLWTDLANALWEVFASGAEARNELLEAWADSDVNGRADALKAVYSILNSIWTIVTAVGDAFRSMLPEITVDTLKSATADLMEFADKLDSTFNALERTIYAPVKEAGKSLPILERFDKAMKLGANGEGVKKLQERLMKLGYDVGASGADGIWGPKTEAAFRRFQEETGKTVDGIYNKDDHLALLDALAKVQKPFEEEEVGTVVTYSEKLQQLRDIFSGIGAVVNIVRGALNFLWKSASELLGAVLSPASEVFLTIGASIGKALVSLDAWITDSEIFENWFASFKEWIWPFATDMKIAREAILSFFGYWEPVDESKKLVTFRDIWESVKTSLKDSGVIDKVTESWENLKSTFKSIKETLAGYWESVKTYLADKFNGAVESAGEWLPNIFTTLGTALGSALDFINSILSKVPGAITSVVEFFTGLYDSVSNSDTVKAAGESLSFAFESIKTAFEDTVPKIKEYWKSAKDWLNEKLGGLFESVKEKFPDILASIGTGLSTAFSWIAKAISNIPTNLGKIKKFFVDLYNKLKNSERLKNAVAKLKSVFEMVKETLGSVWESILSFFGGGKKSKGVAKKLNKGNKDANALDTFEEVSESTEQKVNVIETIWNTIKHVAKTIFSTIVSAVTAIANGIVSVWNAIPAGLRWAIVIVGSIVALGAFVLKVVKAGQGLMDSLTKFKHGYEPQKTSNFAEKLKSFAISVGIIAAAIYVLGSMKTEALTQGAWAIGIITGVLVGISVLFWALGKSPTGAVGAESMNKIFSSIEKLCIGIGIVAAAVIVLGLMPLNVLIKGGFAVAVLGGLVIGLAWLAMQVLNGKSSFVSVSVTLKGLMGLATAIGILALIVYLIGKNMSMAEIGKGLLVVGVLGLLMGAIIWVVSKFSKTGTIKIKGMLAVAAAIGVMALCVYKLGKMDSNEMWRGIGAISIISVLVAGLLATSALVGSNSSWTGFATMLVLFGGLCSIIETLGNVMTKIKDVDPKVMTAFATNLGVAVGAIVVLAAASWAAGTFSNIGQMAQGAAAIGIAFDAIVAIVGALLLGMGALDEYMRENGSSDAGLVDYLTTGSAAVAAIGGAITAFHDSLPLGYGEAIALGSLIIGLIPGGFLATIAGATAIGLAFDAFVLTVGALITGLGALNQTADDNGGPGPLEQLITSGGAVLGAIGGALAQLQSGYISVVTGDIEGIASALESMKAAADGLSEEKIQEDLDAATKLIDRIHTKFSEIKPYDFTSQPNIAGYATAASQLGTDMEAVGTGLLSIRTGISGLHNEFKIENDLSIAVNIASRMHTFFSDLKTYDVTSQPFNADSYFTAPEQLATDMQTFGEAIKNFRVNLGGITDQGLETDTTTAISAAQAVRGFFDQIFVETTALEESGQSVSDFYNKVNTSLTEVGNFSGVMKDFADNLTSGGWTEADIVAATGAAISAATDVKDFLVQLAPISNQIERKRGLFDNLFGEKTTQDTIFQAIEDLGKKAGSAANKVSNYEEKDINKMSNALEIATGMVRVLSSIHDIGLGTDDIDSFYLGKVIDAVGNFGDNLNVLWTIFADIKTTTGESFSEGKDFKSAWRLLDDLISFARRARDLGTENGEIVSNPIENLQTIIGCIYTLASHIQFMKNNLSDKSVGYFNDTVAGIQNIANSLSTLGALAPEQINAAVSSIQSAITGADWSVDTEAIVSAISESIDQSVIDGLGIDVMTMLGDSMVANSPLATSLSTVVDDAINNAKSKTNRTSFENVGKYFVDGIAQGINNNVPTVTFAVREMVGEMIKSANTAALIKSPSRKGAEIGMYFDLGIAQGVSDYSEDVSAASRRMIADLVGSASSAAATITSIINDDMDNQPVIRPVLDLSNISANAGRMNGLFGSRTIGLTGAELAGRVQTNANSIPVGSRSNFNTTEAIQSVNERLDNLGEAMTHMKVVMDSGVLAGEIAPKVDKNLGKVIARKGRG